MNLGAAPHLKALTLANLKSLAALEGPGSSALERLSIFKTPELDFLQLLEQPLPALKSLQLVTGKRKLDQQIQERLKELWRISE